MANKNLFKSLVGRRLPAADAVNAHGAPAYGFTPGHALAQYAATGCLNATFYADAEQQLQTVLALCEEVPPLLIAKTAIYARQRAAMKDLPALLLAVLSTQSPALLEAAFPRVIDNARMLRTFVQIMRSGAVGRKSLGSVPKRLIAEWIAARTETDLLFDAVGSSPSLADVVKMVHPRPATPARAALYGYLLGRPLDEGAAALLPAPVRELEAFRRDPRLPVPRLPFQVLAGLPLGTREWTEIARRASWQTTRMNLNTFLRHGVFAEPGMVPLLADRLRDPLQIAGARALPYQLMVAAAQADAALPAPLRDALAEALEIAIRNVPEVAGKLYVLLDVSGSMRTPVTGHQPGATTAVRCVDVAALMAASLLRRNPQAEVLPFAETVWPVAIDAADPVMVNAQKLALVNGGGTNCSAPLALLNQRRAQGDLVVYVSDNQSWLDTGPRQIGTSTLAEWQRFKLRNPAARLVCIDLQPCADTQAVERADVTNVGGFSDQVFQLLADVAAGRAEAGHWLRQIESLPLAEPAAPPRLAPPAGQGTATPPAAPP